MRIAEYHPKTRHVAAALAVTAALAMPLGPAVALADTLDTDAALESVMSIAEPVQEYDGGIDLMAATKAPQYDYQVYYLDGFGDTWYNDREVPRYFYIRTNNPNANFTFTLDGCTTIYRTISSGQFYDVDDKGKSGYFLRVDGGYIAGVAFEPSTAGAKTIRLYETNGSYLGAQAATFTANFKDYDQAVYNWAKDAISRYGKSIKDPYEKLCAVADGLLSEFVYPYNDGNHVTPMVTKPDSPFFITKRWDSYVSPAMVTYIANMIGGFDDVHNCYYDYPRGTAEWMTFHAQCRVRFDGEERYVDACPYMDSNEIHSIKKINFKNTSSSTFDVPQNFKANDPQSNAAVKHKITVKSDHGTVTVAGGNTAAADEKVSFTIKEAIGYEVSSVKVTTSSGKSVTVSGSGTSRFFTMPNEDVTIEVKYLAVMAQSRFYFKGGPKDSYSVLVSQVGKKVEEEIPSYDGYTVASVTAKTESGKTVSVTWSQTKFSYTLPEEDVEVTVTYKKTAAETSSYSVKYVNCPENIESAGVDKVGATIELNIPTYDGYPIISITAVTKSGKTVPLYGSGSTRSFVMPNEHVTVTVTYQGDESSKPEPEYTLSIGESNFPTGDNSVGGFVATSKKTEGETVSYDVDSYEGFTAFISVVTASGKTVKYTQSGETISFVMPAEDVQVSIKYTKDEVRKGYISLIQPEEGGTVSKDPLIAAAGEEVKIFTEPDDGWKVGSITVVDARDNTLDISETANGTWSFTMPATDVIVRVNFVKDTAYRVKYNTPDHSKIYLQDKEYAPGEQVFYMITPDDGYGVSSIKATDASGKEVELSGPYAMPDGLRYILTMPESDVTITAAVEKDDTALPVTVKGTHCTILAPEKVVPGQDVSIHVTPDEGYTLDNRYPTIDDGTGWPISVFPTGDGDFTFEMPNNPVTVTFEAAKVEDGDQGDEGGDGDHDADDYPVQLFDDVPSDAWYSESVAWAVENDVMHGYEGSNSFGPDDSITRAQMATVLYNVAKNPDVDPSIMDEFGDCESGSWYGEAVSWAVEEGIFSGYSDTGLFGPNDPITREQIAVVLWRQAGEPTSTAGLSQFPDGSETSPWALDAMTWAVEEGIFSGNSTTGELMPTGKLTRAEAATVMMRLLS